MLSREKVEAVLFKMGMPANVKGFGYIVAVSYTHLRAHET